MYARYHFRFPSPCLMVLYQTVINVWHIYADLNTVDWQLAVRYEIELIKKKSYVLIKACHFHCFRLFFFTLNQSIWHGILHFFLNITGTCQCFLHTVNVHLLGNTYFTFHQLSQFHHVFILLILVIEVRKCTKFSHKTFF